MTSTASIDPAQGDHERPVPSHVPAERALLGACMETPGAFADARALILDEDFYQPRHATIWSTICALVDAGRSATPMVVMTELAKANQLESIGGSPYLFSLVEARGTGSIGYCAQQMRQAAQARKLISVGQRLAQLGEQNWLDNDSMLSQAAALLIDGEVVVDEHVGDEPLTDMVRFDYLWSTTTATEVTWLVPDMLVRGDVWIMLGGEGGGKSYFSRQLVMCLAAGIHPLKPNTEIAPLRALLVDLENDADMLAYETHKIGQEIGQIRPLEQSKMAVWHHPRGLNLREHRDQVLFERHIAEFQPDFVAMGSLFKTFKRGRDDWDTAADELREFLDTMRTRYGFALLLEHHMRKAAPGASRDATPYGAITWQQWPSLGHAIERCGDNAWSLTPYRGNRLNRDLPVGLHRHGQLPWTPIWDQLELDETSWKRHRGRHGQWA